MSASHSFKSLAFRVLLNPAPRTQSESNAVLRVLKDYGPIHTFQILHHLPANNSDAHHDKAQTGTSAILVFTHNTKAVYGLRSDKSGHRFTVIANGDITDPSVKDPYNVRGLRSRKPELEPREIECCVIPVEEEGGGDGRERSVLDALKRNPYSNGYAVDRDSIFAEILDRTDCPSGLIHGLLPKLDDEHRSAALDQGLTKTEIELVAELSMPAKQVHLKKSDLTEPNNSQPMATATAQQEDLILDGNPKDQVMPLDKFADLKDISLMQMYRDAVHAARPQTDGAVTAFSPFSNKP